MGSAETSTLRCIYCYLTVVDESVILKILFNPIVISLPDVVAQNCLC